MKRSLFWDIGPSRLLKVSSGGTYFIFGVEDYAKQDSLLYYSSALKMDVACTSRKLDCILNLNKYLELQFIPHRKHIMSRLQSPTG
jgi:hypothetical protein